MTIYATAYTFGDAIPQIHNIYNASTVSIAEVKEKIEVLLSQMGYINLTSWSIARNMVDAICITATKGNRTITFSIRQTEVLSSI